MECIEYLRQNIIEILVQHEIQFAIVLECCFDEQWFTSVNCRCPENEFDREGKSVSATNMQFFSSRFGAKIALNIFTLFLWCVVLCKYILSFPLALLIGRCTLLVHGNCDNFYEISPNINDHAVILSGFDVNRSEQHTINQKTQSKNGNKLNKIRSYSTISNSNLKHYMFHYTFLTFPLWQGFLLVHK